jgi:GDP-L-fucose synthase
MEFDGEVVWEVDKPNGQPRRCLDIKRAKHTFGFHSQIRFSQGLQNTINWYRQNADATPSTAPESADNIANRS